MDSALVESNEFEKLPLIDAVILEADSPPKHAVAFEERKYRLPSPPATVQADTLPKEADPNNAELIGIKIECGVYDLLRVGVRGQGVRIGFLDTGVDATHPDLSPNFDLFKDFCDVDQTPRDPVGHGTGVCGVACGKGRGNPKFGGVAPDARIVMARVIDEDGWARESDIIKGLDWLVQQGVDIVNMSLGFETDVYGPLEMAMEAVSVPIVVAAGNDGPNKHIMAPGNVSSATVVAACDQNGNHSFFSSVGPTVSKNRLTIPKPDVMAWGQNVPMPRARNTSMGTVINDLYCMADGTSFATPFVAGCYALYRSAQKPAELAMAAAVSTAKDDPRTSYDLEGSGKINVAGMISYEGGQLPVEPPRRGCLFGPLGALMEILRSC
jgi:subtilisin family serine protease